MIDSAGWLFLLIQIFFVDLLLGADNALVIALACRRLPPEQTRRAILLGAIGAIGLRLVMLLFANALLGVPLVKLVSAWMLVVIALKVRARRRDEGASGVMRLRIAGDLVSAAAVIMLADVAMSLDNVVALAAIAGGDFWLMSVGVLVSIPIIAYGALVLSAIVRRAPEILVVGAAFLGWVAGAMAVSDPLVAGSVQADAPALGVLAPAIVAAFVLFAGERPDVKEVGAAISPTMPPPRLRPSAPSPRGCLVAAPRAAIASTPASGGPEDRPPAFPSGGPAASTRGWTEERVVVAGLVLVAFIAGLIIVIASFFHNLT
jgi:YjbE family integral membrane protein